MTYADFLVESRQQFDNFDSDWKVLTWFDRKAAKNYEKTMGISKKTFILVEFELIFKNWKKESRQAISIEGKFFVWMKCFFAFLQQTKLLPNQRKF